MPKFLTTHATAYYIEEVIQRAERELTLITPYLKLSRVLLDRLKDADRRGVRIRIVYGKAELRPDERTKLGELEHLAVYFLENLHAKCYANQRQVVISSMNMYEFSEKTNREMGVLLSSADDAEAFGEAQREVESIVAAAEEQRASRPSARPRQPARPAPEARPKPHGFCIRCAGRITYRPDAPLCPDCYSSWASWGNEDYPEKRCHRCGEAHQTSKARPLCHTCFRADPFTPRSRAGL